MDLNEIREHWEQSGRTFSMDENVTPTTRDPYLGQLERDNFLLFLDENHSCLEIGCGDASHSMHYARRTKSLFGVDVASSLVELAAQRAQDESVTNAEFAVGSVLDIETIAAGRNFDCVISQRCFINLPSWEHQRDAIQHVYNVLPKGGMLLLTEGFQENLEALNLARGEMGLPSIRVVDYNRNFLLEEFEPFIKERFEVVDVRYYGAYIFFSRVYHPLVVAPESPRHDDKMNEVAMELQKKMSVSEMDRYSYGIFYALRKL